MSRTGTYRLLIVLGVGFDALLSSQQAAGQLNRASLEIAQLGGPAQGFRMEVRQLGFGGTRTTFIAPDGTQLGRNHQLLHLPTFADVERRLLGVWTIEVDPFAPMPDESYRFTLTPFSLEDVFHEPPTIIRPGHNATVPPEFVMQWRFDAGVTPTAGPTARVFQRGEVGATVSFGEFRGLSIPITAELKEGVRQARLFLTAGTREPLSHLLSAVEPTSPRANRNIELDASFSNLAAEITVFARELSAADFDQDGDVDGRDFLAWQAGFGMLEAAAKSQGDADSDRDVDRADFLQWQNQFASGRRRLVSQAVPEPGGMALLLLAAWCLGQRCSLRIGR